MSHNESNYGVSDHLYWSKRPKSEFWRNHDKCGRNSYSAPQRDVEGKVRPLNLHQVLSDVFKNFGTGTWFLLRHLSSIFSKETIRMGSANDGLQKRPGSPQVPEIFQGTMSIEALQNHLRPLPRFQEVFLET